MEHHPDTAVEPVAGIFDRRRQAEACLRSLHENGFTDAEVGHAGPPHLAGFYECQARAGRFLVAVRGGNQAEAARIVADQGGRLESSTGEATGGIAETPETVEGEFETKAVADAVAEQLKAAFPDRVVTVDDAGANLHVLGPRVERPRRIRVRVSA